MEATPYAGNYTTRRTTMDGERIYALRDGHVFVGAIRRVDGGWLADACGFTFYEVCRSKTDAEMRMAAAHRDFRMTVSR